MKVISCAVAGAVGVGKTSLIKRLLQFDDVSITTSFVLNNPGQTHFMKLINAELFVELFELDGVGNAFNFGNYVRFVEAFVVVFEVSNLESYDYAKRLIFETVQNSREKRHKHLKVVLVANNVGNSAGNMEETPEVSVTQVRKDFENVDVSIYEMDMADTMQHELFGEDLQSIKAKTAKTSENKTKWRRCWFWK